MSLYKYQEDGVDFLLAQRRRYLADGMGLGKTVQACVAAARTDARRVLVVAPASTLPNWYHEWGEWGSDAQFAAASYNKLVAKPHHFIGRDWDLVILDEAHYAKSRESQRTRASLTLARQAPRAWLLSGTPAPNGPHELWSPIKALWPGIPRALGISTYIEWLNTFCHWSMGDYGPKVWGGKNGHLLRPYLNRIMLRRRLADVGIELPPLRIDVSLLPHDTQLDAALIDAGIDPALVHNEMHWAEVDGKTSTVRRVLGTLKAARIARILDDELRHQQYPKIVVLAHHRDTMKLVGDILRPHGVVGFDGRTPKKARQEAIERFRYEHDVRVFLAQQNAAGTGVDGLQVASEMALLEPSFNPDENAQYIKRIHRIGSEHPCRARMFAVRGTLDEGIMRVNARKTKAKMEFGL